jgi:hypothetical protein
MGGVGLATRQHRGTHNSMASCGWAFCSRGRGGEEGGHSKALRQPRKWFWLRQWQAHAQKRHSSARKGGGGSGPAAASILHSLMGAEWRATTAVTLQTQGEQSKTVSQVLRKEPGRGAGRP